MKLATIGSGAIVDQALDSIKDVEGIELEAAYSRTMEKAEAFAGKHGFKKAYDSLDQMFADPEIDAVYIASPNSLHYPQAKQALEAGKHVLLEKPFAPSTKQSEELFELAEKNGLMLFEAITSIHTPNFGLLKDSLEAAGNVKQCVFNFSQYSSRYDNYKKGIVANVFDPAMDGGALGDINIYNIHLALGLFGMPEGAAYYPNLGFNGVDTSGTLLLLYPGFTVTCIGAKDCKADYLFTIEGDDGTFSITDGSSGKMNRVDFVPVHPEEGQEIPVKISIDQGPHMTYEFLDFLTAVQENDREMYERFKKQTLMAAQIMDAAKAMKDEKWEEIQAHSSKGDQ